MPSSVWPPHPAIRGWSRLGSLIAPTAATHETNYTGKSGNPQSRRRESIWKRHIVLRFHFLSNAAKLSEFLQLVGEINYALCFTVPPLLFRASIILHGVWMLKGQHLFSVSSSPGGATKFPQRQIFSVKTWIMSSQTLPHFQLYLWCPEHKFLHGIDTKAKECIYSLICFLSFI